MGLIRRVPLPMSALALGTAALGNLLAPYSPNIRVVCGVVAAALVLLVALRLVVDFRAVRDQLAEPGVMAVFPAFFMALMLLATYLKPFAAVPARALWFAAIAMQLCLVVLFVVRSVRRPSLASVTPAWFLVFVGFVVASVTSPAFQTEAIGLPLLYAGLAGYAVILPVVVIRLVKAGPLPAPALPTMAIFAAPPSLCLVGYLAIAPVKHVAVVYALLFAVVASLTFVLASLPRILRAPFSPAYAALTFPLVVTAIAVKQALAAIPAMAGSAVPSVVVPLTDAMAATAVLYVLLRYVVFLAQPPAELQPEPATAAA